MAEHRDEFGEYLFDDEEHEIEYSEESGLKESTVILIDCQPSMWEECTLDDKDLAGKTWLEACIKGSINVMSQRLLEGGLDEVGVAFYNFGNPTVLQTAENMGYARVQCEFKSNKIETPTTLTLKTLREFEPSSLGPGDAAPGVRTSALTNALWAAHTALPGISKLKTSDAGVISYGARRVMVLTRDADPTDGGADGADISRALDKVNNIGKKGGTLELVPLVGPDDEFDLAPFWAALLERQAEASAATQMQHSLAPSLGPLSIEEDDRIISFRSLSSFVRARVHRKRAMSSQIWGLGHGGSAIGVRMYATVRLATRGPITYFENEKLDELVRQTDKVDQITGEIVGNAGKAQRCYPKLPPPPPLPKEGETPKAPKPSPRLPRVVLTGDDLQDIKSPATLRGMELLGFKPTSALAPWQQLRDAAFLRPHEAAVSGSTVTFSAILDACLQRDVMALVTLVRIPNAQPLLYALLPQAEERDPASGAQIAAAGFHMIHLPTFEDVRSPEKDVGLIGTAPAAPTAAAIATAKSVMERLCIDDFDSTALRDPAMQLFFKVLEARVEGVSAPQVQDTPEIFDDTLTPLVDDFPEDLLHQFKRLMCHAAAIEDKYLEGAKFQKRKAPEPEAEAPAGEDGGYTDEQLRRMDLESLTGVQLQAILRIRKTRRPDLKLKVTGKKAELIERVQAYLAG